MPQRTGALNVAARLGNLTRGALRNQPVVTASMRFFTNVAKRVAAGACVPVQTLIDRTAGSIGTDMSNSGAAFDGTTSQNHVGGAHKSGAYYASAYIGKDWGSGVVHSLTGWKIWGSTNEGYTSHASPSITVKLYGSNSGIESSGTELDSQSFSDATPGAKSFLSGVTAGNYRYHWIKFTGSGHEWRLAELQFFEDVCP